MWKCPCSQLGELKFWILLRLAAVFSTPRTAVTKKPFAAIGSPDRQRWLWHWLFLEQRSPESVSACKWRLCCALCIRGSKINFTALLLIFGFVKHSCNKFVVIIHVCSQVCTSSALSLVYWGKWLKKNEGVHGKKKRKTNLKGLWYFPVITGVVPIPFLTDKLAQLSSGN